MAKWRWPSLCACLSKTRPFELTNYASFLEQFPPEFECEIVDNTSWSCAHGVERWRSNCGCNGGHPVGTRQWRAPLRQALDGLRDALIPLTEVGRRKFSATSGPRAMPTSRSFSTAAKRIVDRFFSPRHHTLDATERVRALELMEMQRHAQLMYTSCGWFFDDIAGIETVQVIAYAARVLQLARRIFGEGLWTRLKPAFTARMAEAQSNVPAAGDGAEIYKKCVATMELSLEQVAAHYAISSVFSSFADEIDLYCYRVRRISYEIFNPAADAWRSGACTLPAPSPAASRPSRLRFSTSATRTLPLRSSLTSTPTRPPLKTSPGRPQATCSAPIFLR